MSTHERLFSELPNQNTFRVIEEENLFDTPGSEDECVHRLAAAVVFSAMQDAAGRTIGHKKEKEEVKERARAWLIDEENDDTWFFLAGIRRKDVLNWVEVGCKKIEHHLSPACVREKSHFPKYQLKTESYDRRKLEAIDPDLGPEY